MVRIFYEIAVRSIFPPELCNGVGGERTVKDFNLNHMEVMLKATCQETNLK